MTYLDKEWVCLNSGKKNDSLEETGAEQSSDDIVKTITFLNPKCILLHDTLSIITHVLTNSIKRCFLIKYLQTKLTKKFLYFGK